MSKVQGRPPHPRIGRWAPFVFTAATVACQAGDDATPVTAASSTGALTLEASKTYNPSTWLDDTRALDAPVRFHVPAELPVVVGNAGNHQATLRFHLGASADTTCTYKGGADQAHPAGDVQIAKGLRYLLQGCSDGTIAGASVVADHLRLSIANGDSWSPTKTNARTTVRVTLPTYPVERHVAILVTPTASLFTAAGQTRALTARAFDLDEETEIPVATLGLQWVTTRPGDVALVDDGGGHATITAATDLGYSTVVARATTEPGLVSPPVAVRIAHLQPGVAVLDDASVLYPPRPMTPLETLDDLEGYEVCDDGLTIGGFTLDEVLTHYVIDTDGDAGPRVIAPVVVRTDAYDPAQPLLVGGESLDSPGRVLAAETRGDYTLLDVEAVAPTVLYQNYEYQFDGNALSQQGLFVAGRLGDDAGAAAAVPGVGALAKAPGAPTLDGVIPPGLEAWNREGCASGQLSTFKILGLAPTIKPAIIPPVGGLRIGNGQETYFMIYGGVRVEAGIRPELDLQADGQVSLDCYIGPEVRVPLGLSALTGSTIDLSWTFQPRLRAQVRVAGGPRINGFVLAQGTLTATVGVRYEDGQLYTSDPTIGDYNRFDVTWQFDKGVSFSTLGGTQIDNDALVDGRVGVVGEKRLNIQLGGVLLDQLRRFLELAQRASGGREAILRNLERLGAGRVLRGFGIVRVADLDPADLLVNGLGIADALLRLTQIAFMKVEVPIELRQRWESGRRTLNEADASVWYADEHQIFSVESAPTVEIGLVDLKAFLQKLLPVDTTPLTINVTTPPIELVNFYKGFQADGNIRSRVIKGAGNSEPRFQVGDRLWLHVPGRYGQYTGIDAPGVAQLSTPRDATVYTETTTAYDQVGTLAYRGIQNGFLVFEGTIDVTADLVGYLNDGKELFTLGWNKMVALETDGYLNSYNGYTFSTVDLQAPSSVTLTGEVGGHARAGVRVANQSRVDNEPAPADFTTETTVPGLVVTPASGTIGANTGASLDLDVACAAEGTSTGTLTIHGTIHDADGNPIEGATEIAVTVTCVDVDCPLGAIPDPTGVTTCACDSYAGWIVVPGTNTCQCDPNRGFTFDAATETCLSCRDRDPTRPYWDTGTQQCTECPFGAIPNPTGVTACACDSSRGFTIVSPDSPNPDACECAADRPRYDAPADTCQACPADEPRYNPTTGQCDGACDDPAAPFYNHATHQCEACPSATPTWNASLGVCEAACPGGSGSGNDAPFTGSFELGAPGGVFTFTREHYTIKDRMQVIYEGRVLHDTGCTGGGESIPIAYNGSATNVIVKVIPNCEGSSGTAWDFSVSCPQ